MTGGARYVGGVKIFGTIRPIETREVTVEAPSYEAGLKLIKSEVRRAGSC
jgi:hypothetical protein